MKESSTQWSSGMNSGIATRTSTGESAVHSLTSSSRRVRRKDRLSLGHFENTLKTATENTCNILLHLEGWHVESTGLVTTSSSVEGCLDHLRRRDCSSGMSRHES
jgi:hypothetical protein